MGIQEQGWAMDIIRGFFSILDKLVYSLVKWILFGIFDLANITTNSEVFSGIYSRIYVVLGIFMAFKLSFAFFQYIIDPDSMSGKSDKSLSKIFIRVFLMLGALIILPTVLFGQNGQEGLLSRAQRAFLPTLPKVIFGVDNLGGLTSDTSSSQFIDSVEQSANDITVTTLKGFFATPEDIDSVCGAGTYDSIPQIESLDEFSANVNLTCNRAGEIQVGVGPIHTGTRYYKYSYMWFISTIVGVLIAVLLLSITLDLAKRLFKLMILEVIAPVPIMSLIDPKATKDGAFSKWVKSLSSTFLDIFFKLGLVYIIVVFIHLIVDSVSTGKLFNNFPQNAGFRGTYLTILLILGLIFFAKEAPKFIKDAMGFKGGDGKGLFDDVKAVGKAAGLVGGAAVGTAGVFGSMATNYRAAKEENKDLHPNSKANGLRNVGSALAGAIGGAAVGAKALTGKNAGIKSVLEAQGKRNARRASHSTLLGRGEDNIYAMFTGRSLATRDQAILDANKAAADSLKAYKSTAVDEAMKKGSHGFVPKDKDRTGHLAGKGFNYRQLEAAMGAKDEHGNFKYSYIELDNDGNAVKDANGNYVTHEATFNVSEFDSNTMASIEDSQTDGYLTSNWGQRDDGTIGFKNDKINTEWQTTRHNLNEADIKFTGSYLGQATSDKRLDKDGKAISNYGEIGFAIGTAKKKVSDMTSDVRNIKHRANKQNKN